MNWSALNHPLVWFFALAIVAPLLPILVPLALYALACAVPIVLALLIFHALVH